MRLLRGVPSATMIKAAVLVATLIGTIILPVFSIPKQVDAGGGIDNTRGDDWNTEEVAGSAWLDGAGVSIYSNGSSAAVHSPQKDNYIDNSNGVSTKTGIEWQCVELINRLYISKGWISDRWSGDGSQMFDNAPTKLSKEADGNITYVSPGDVIAMTGGADNAGHVAIVAAVSGSSIKIASQNTTSVFNSAISLNNKTLTTASWSGYHMTGVIHHPGPDLPSPPAGEGGGNAASWAPDRMDVFYNGTDSHMWHNWHDGAGWHAYEQDPPGGENVTLTSQVAAVSWGSGRLDVFARSQSASLLHKWFINGAGWSHWEDLGGCIIGAPTVGSWVSGRLDIFVQGCNDTGINMHHRWYDGSWHSWEVVPNLSARISSPPSVVSWGTNRLDIFARGEGADLIHNWYDGSWHGADSQGGCIIGQPAVSAWSPGRLDVFVEDCNTNGPNVSYKYYASNAWQPWQTIPLNDNVTVTSMLGAISSADNRIDIFARGTDGVMQHKWYDNIWNHWESLSGSIAP